MCVCVHRNVCLRCLEHITAGKPNLPATVLIKAVFLRLSLDGRQDQLHKMTGTRTGRLPQPHWHPLWTSPDFKRYSPSDYRLTDWVKKKKKRGKRESVSFKSPISKHWHFAAFETWAVAWKPTDTGRQSEPILKVNKKTQMLHEGKLQYSGGKQQRLCVPALTAELWIRRGWVGERRAETAHQSALRTPFPPHFL